MHRPPTLHFSFDFAIDRCRQWVPPRKVCLLSGIGPIPSQHGFHDDGAVFWCSSLATHPTAHWSTGCCIHATLLQSNHHVMTMSILGWIEDPPPGSLVERHQISPCHRDGAVMIGTQHVVHLVGHMLEECVHQDIGIRFHGAKVRILKGQDFETLPNGHLLIEGQELLWSQQTVSEPHIDLSGDINVLTTACKAEPVDVQ